MSFDRLAYYDRSVAGYFRETRWHLRRAREWEDRLRALSRPCEGVYPHNVDATLASRLDIPQGYRIAHVHMLVPREGCVRAWKQALQSFFWHVTSSAWSRRMAQDEMRYRKLARVERKVA